MKRLLVGLAFAVALLAPPALAGPHGYGGHMGGGHMFGGEHFGLHPHFSPFRGEGRPHQFFHRGHWFPWGAIAFGGPGPGRCYYPGFGWYWCGY